MLNGALRWVMAPCLSMALTTFAAVLAAVFAVSAGAQVPPASVMPVWHYTVRPGDTLIGLGKRYLRDPSQWLLVQRANAVRNPRRLPPGMVLRIPASLLLVAPAHARLVAAYGTVRWSSGGDWQPARNGQDIAAGDAIRTGSDGSAVVTLANGTRIKLPPSTVLRFDTLSAYAGGLMADTRLRLQEGRIEIDDNPDRLPNQNLHILTPSAQAVVRGTRFRAEYDAVGVTREETTAGSVALTSAGAAVLVDAGQGSAAAPGKPPMPPVPLLPAPDLGTPPPPCTALPLHIHAPELPGAVAWQGSIAPIDTPDRVVVQKRFPASGAAPGWTVADLPDGRYRLTLRGIDANGLQGQAAQAEIRVAARPFFPVLLQPGRGATVRQPRPEFRWTATEGVDHTELQLARSTDFSAPLADIRVTGQSWTPAADLPAGTTYWRTASLRADGTRGPWSPASAMHYLPGPGSADIAGAAVTFDRDHVMVELAAAPPGQHYALTLANDAALHDPLAQATSTGGMVRLPRPSGGTRYLAARLVDNADGTAGPDVMRAIDVPPRYPYLWLLAIPLLPLL